MDMRDGSPSIVRQSCPQLQAARRVVMGWLRSCRCRRVTWCGADKGEVGFGHCLEAPHITPMWLLLRHATCAFAECNKGEVRIGVLLDVSSLEVQRPRLLDFAFKAGLHRK